MSSEILQEAGPKKVHSIDEHFVPCVIDSLKRRLFQIIDAPLEREIRRKTRRLKPRQDSSIEDIVDELIVSLNEELPKNPDIVCQEEKEATKKLTIDELDIVKRNLLLEKDFINNSESGKVYTLELDSSKGILKDNGIKLRLRIEGGVARFTVKVLNNRKQLSFSEYDKDAYEIHIPLGKGKTKKSKEKFLRELVNKKNLGDFFGIADAYLEDADYSQKIRTSFTYYYKGKKFLVDIDEKDISQKIDVEGGTTEENLEVIEELTKIHRGENIEALEYYISDITEDNGTIKGGKLPKLRGVLNDIFSRIIFEGSTFLTKIKKLRGPEWVDDNVPADLVKVESEREERLRELSRTIINTAINIKGTRLELESETTRLVEEGTFTRIREGLDKAISDKGGVHNDLSGITRDEAEIYTLRIDDEDRPFKIMGIKTRVRIDNGESVLSLKLLIEKFGTQVTGSHKEALEVHFPFDLDVYFKEKRKQLEVNIEDAIKAETLDKRSELLSLVGNFKKLRKKSRVSYTMFYKGKEYHVDLDDKKDPYKIDIEGGTELENIQLYRYLVDKHWN